MTTVTTKSLAVTQFGEMFLKGLEHLNAACQIYVNALDSNPKAKKEFEDAYPEIPPSAWNRFEAVGRGDLHAKLLTNFTCGAKKLEHCSFSEQSKYVKEPVEVLSAKGDRLKIDIHNLTPEQSKQVFAKDHVRNLAEQRAYIESLKTEEIVDKARKLAIKPYLVTKNKLVVGDVVFEKSDLLKILMEMEDR